jgi:hypothetical protein
MVGGAADATLCTPSAKGNEVAVVGEAGAVTAVMEDGAVQEEEDMEEEEEGDTTFRCYLVALASTRDVLRIGVASLHATYVVLP